MRIPTWIFVLLLGFGGAAQAQPSWDAGATLGSFGAAPTTPNQTYRDEWYFDFRQAVSIGRYWSDHIKTEIEFANTGEGTRYTLRTANVPGVPPQYPISSEEYYRLQQLQARVVYQFFENVWAHPYVFGGVGVDIERLRTRTPEQYYYASGDPRLPANRILITPARETGPAITQRAAGILGTGVKLYMSPRAYFNAAAIASLARSSGTISFVTGFGFDF
jgi:hypothetical protein